MIDLQTLLNYVAMISIPVGVTYHIMTLYNTRRNQRLTLETRQAQLFMQLYQRTIDEEANRRWSKQMQYQWEDFEDFQKKYGQNSEDLTTVLHTTWQQFNGVGLLLRRGLIDRETAYGLSGGWRAVLIWMKWKNIIAEMRERYYNPDYMDGLEFLGVEMMKYREEKGLPNTLPPGFHN